MARLRRWWDGRDRRSISHVQPNATSSTRLTFKGCIGVTRRGRFGRQANTASVGSALSLALRDIRLWDAAFQVAPSGRPVVCDKRFDSEIRMMPTDRWEACDEFGQRCGAVRGSMPLEGDEAWRRLSRVSWSRDVDAGGYVPSEATQRLGGTSKLSESRRWARWGAQMPDGANGGGFCQVIRRTGHGFLVSLGGRVIGWWTVPAGDGLRYLYVRSMFRLGNVRMDPCDGN